MALFRWKVSAYRSLTENNQGVQHCKLWEESTFSNYHFKKIWGRILAG